MFFRQLFDRKSCTYTYVLADESTREAVIIDPVDELADRDLQLLKEWGLTLVYILETHVHADHVTGGGVLKQATQAKTLVAAAAGVDCADIQAKSGDTLTFGSQRLEVRSTPGHTGGCISFVHHGEGLVFTGDTLFVRGCGRTDFQQGDAATLYKSVHEQIFTLPDTTKVYPAHDYKGRTASTVGEEKAFNPRLGGGNTVEEFVAIMGALNLSNPAMMHIAVPANMACGRRAPADA
jgi:glyoxylase-like metal-dependent hydrolase (beta-lactamase superfamily II)